MSGPAGSFADPELARLLAGWNTRWAGCEIFRVAAGPGWISLHLPGPQRPAILLTALPGANRILAHAGPLPAPLERLLAPVRDHPLRRLLQGSRLSACGALSSDRVACFKLRTEAAQDVFLLHKLFGAQGAFSLLDPQAKVLWASHRPPHPLLAAVPGAKVWTAAPGDAQISPAASPAASLPDSPPDSPPDVPADLPAGGEPPGALAELAARLAATLAGQLEIQLLRLQRTTDRLVQNVTADLENADRGEGYRRCAEALAANLHLVRQGQDVLTTPDLRDGAALTIALDPALSPAANLDAWFRKAGKAEKGRQIIADRLQEASARSARLAAGLQELQGILAAHTTQADPLDLMAALQQWRAERRDWFPDTSPKAQRRRDASGPEERLRPFRRYLIDGRWEAWVGRSNEENDELTHHASHPADLWLHAQGVPGSHVILRTQGHPEQVPRSALDKAAQLAALHSKARHSGLVPVIVTERRYVRKPRKSAPGIAVCTREKTVFAQPAVAEGVVLT